MEDFLWLLLYILIVWLPWIALAGTLGLGAVCLAQTIRIKQGEKQGLNMADVAQAKEKLVKLLFILILVTCLLWLLRSLLFSAASMTQI